jgi:hypothetical protein
MKALIKSESHEKRGNFCTSLDYQKGIYFWTLFILLNVRLVSCTSFLLHLIFPRLIFVMGMKLCVSC